MACTSGSFSISSGVPFLEDAAVVHHRHPLGHAQRHVEIVLDDDVADVGRQRVEDRDEVAPLGRRQAGGRLVEQDEARRAGERQRDLELALLAMAELADRRVADGSSLTARRMRSAWARMASSRRARSSEKRRRDTPRQPR